MSLCVPTPICVYVISSIPSHSIMYHITYSDQCVHAINVSSLLHLNLCTYICSHSLYYLQYIPLPFLGTYFRMSISEWMYIISVFLCTYLCSSSNVLYLPMFEYQCSVPTYVRVPMFCTYFCSSTNVLYRTFVRVSPMYSSTLRGTSFLLYACT